MKDRWKEKIIYALLTVGRWGLNFIYLFHKLCLTKRRISIISRQAEEPYADLQMLSSQLRRLDPDTEVIVSCRMIGDGIAGKISYIGYLITTQMHLFATSQVVVLDTYCIGASMLKHKRGLKIVQMWHAMGAFKKFGYTSIDETEGRSSVIARGMQMHRNYDVVFISSEACRMPMAASFGCDPEKLQVMPLPRTDLVRDPRFLQETGEKIRQAYPQLLGKRVILYTPTFRKAGTILPYAKQLIDVVDYESACLVVKLHPIDGVRIIAKHAIIDRAFSSQEWLSVADDVITDYSAFVFEAAAAGKRIYRFVPDDTAYDRERGFLIDVETEFPFFESGDAQEVLRAVAEERCDPQALQAFTDKYVQPGEHYTEHMAAYILHLAGAEASA